MLTVLILLSCSWISALAHFPDWLINDFKTPTSLRKTDTGTIILSNGLISREFLLYPDFTTIDYYSHEKQASILRALNPEAVIGLDGIVYNVGYVKTSISRAYLNRTALKDSLQRDDSSFHYAGYDIGVPKAPFPYKPMRGAPQDIVWPPRGLRLDVYFDAPDTAPPSHRSITVCIHYEMYDGIPAMSKWVTISSKFSAWGKVSASVYSVELLSVNQQWAQVSEWDYPYNTYKWMYVGTDQSHGTSVNWIADPSTGRKPGSFEPMVNVSYAVDKNPIPIVVIDESGFESFHVHEIPHGSSDDTRQALARHRLMRMLAPHIQENPIFFHMVKTDDESFKTAIDQLAEVGFEMLIYSFGSGFNMESDNETYIERVRDQVAYAKKKGIEVGGYDLIVLDRGGSIDFKYRALNKDNTTNGHACIASLWYEYIHDKIMTFLDKTGLTMVETDGPYGGETCASTLHLHHNGYEDSVYKQQLLQGKLYMELRKRNIFINQPDEFFYQGGNKEGLGYNENQYSLPRWEDLSVSRQSMFDRIYYLPPTAGWMFLPLTMYHGGGDAATFEPLSEHYNAYNFGLSQYLGAGVAACYRGYRIFDTYETKQLVKKWVSFYKKYRSIITSDIIRVRRPDMQSIDAYMHVNYKLQYKGLAMVFNPTLKYQEMNLTLPLYYTGIRKVAAISEQDSGFVHYELNMGWEVNVMVKLPAEQVTWFVISDGEETKHV